MSKKTISTTETYPKTLLLCTYTTDNKIHDINAYQKEFLSLIQTLEVPYTESLLWKLRAVDASHFLTKGKMKELRDFCEKNAIEEVVCSKELTPLQERNMNTALGCKVFDRTQLILEIFNNSAHTAEGRTQVEIAKLEYLKTRLSGRGKEMAQQAGHIGTKGPGETESESLKRYYANKIKQARKHLKTLEKTKQTQRKQRLSSNIPLVALVGYTNSGKSSILNRLTNSDILAEDKLFSTLDTTTRSLYLEAKKKVLLSDTVGFISELPHHLVEAFKSTLDELKYADLILHVVDMSNPMWQDHIEVAEDILDELEITTNMLYVFNKKDKVEDLETIKPYLEIYNPYVITDAMTKEGIKNLLLYIKNCKFTR